MNRKITIMLLVVTTNIACARPFKLGLENISHALVRSLHGKRIGLITNQTGVDQQGNATVDVLQKAGIDVTAFLVPEHGLYGTVPAGKLVKSSTDPRTHKPVISLYGHGAGRKLGAQMLSAFDVLLFDLQDAGMRHYTYISTLYSVLEAGAEHRKKIIVLDRPNPLGWIMEGPLVDPALHSFISIAPIPVRHSMTMGELAQYFNMHHFSRRVPLTVVPMANYRRDMGLPNTLAIRLSPNIASRESCYGYSFLGLLGEVRPFDVSVGTQKSFQCISLADEMKVDSSWWDTLRTLLQDMNIATRPHVYFNTRKKKKYAGICIKIDNINQVMAFKTLLTVLEHAKKSGIALKFTRGFDLAVGTQHVRDLIEGKMSKEQLSGMVNKQLHTFCAKARRSYLYRPFPRVTELK